MLCTFAVVVAAEDRLVCGLLLDAVEAIETVRWAGGFCCCVEATGPWWRSSAWTAQHSRAELQQGEKGADSSSMAVVSITVVCEVREG